MRLRSRLENTPKRKEIIARPNDTDRREALDNGAKEVDNLASYFEKLRAITYSEAYEAPLSLTTFNLTEAVKVCAAQGGQASSLHITVHSDGKCCDVSNGSWKLPVLVNTPVADTGDTCLGSG